MMVTRKAKAAHLASTWRAPWIFTLETSWNEIKSTEPRDKTAEAVDIDMLLVFYVAILKVTESNPTPTPLMDTAALLLYVLFMLLFPDFEKFL